MTHHRLGAIGVGWMGTVHGLRPQPASIFCEKPGGRDAQETAEIERLARPAGVFTFVGYNYRLEVRRKPREAPSAGLQRGRLRDLPYSARVMAGLFWERDSPAGLESPDRIWEDGYSRSQRTC